MANVQGVAGISTYFEQGTLANLGSSTALASTITINGSLGGYFYLEPSTGTINFGYGTNLSSASTSAQTTIDNNLSGLGVTINWDAISNIPTLAQAHLSEAAWMAEYGQQAAQIVNNLNSQIGANVTAGTVEASASAIVQSYVSTGGTTMNNLLSVLTPNGIAFSLLPQTVQNGLLILAYQSTGLIGTNVVGDLASGLETGDFSKAAYEIALNTGNPFVDQNDVGRYFAAAMTMLGLNPTINTTTGNVSISGTGANGQLIEFLQDVANGQAAASGSYQYNLTPRLDSPKGLAAYQALQSYEISQGFYVVEPGDQLNPSTNGGAPTVTINNQQVPLTGVNLMVGGLTLTPGSYDASQIYSSDSQFSVPVLEGGSAVGTLLADFEASDTFTFSSNAGGNAFTFDNTAQITTASDGAGGTIFTVYNPSSGVTRTVDFQQGGNIVYSAPDGSIQPQTFAPGSQISVSNGSIYEGPVGSTPPGTPGSTPMEQLAYDGDDIDSLTVDGMQFLENLSNGQNGTIATGAQLLTPPPPPSTLTQYTDTVGDTIADQFIQLALHNDIPAQLVTQALANTVIDNVAYNLIDNGPINIGFGPNSFGNNLIDAVGGFVGSDLGAMLAQNLGINAQLGSVIGGSVGQAALQQLANLVATKAFDSAPLFAGDFAGNLESSLAGALGSFAGSELAELTFDGKPEGEAIGSAIGGAVGSLAGVTIAAGGDLVAGLAGALAGNIVPIVGMFIGALIGSFLGGGAGGLFGPGPANPWSMATITLGANDQFYIDGTQTDHTGPGVALQVGGAVVSDLNSILGMVGGIATAPVFFGPGGLGQAEFVTIGLGTEVGGQGIVGNRISGIYGDAETAIDLTVISALKSLTFQGGDIFLETAIQNTNATTLTQLQIDLQVARDYETFLQNPFLFNEALLTSSDPTIGEQWAAELVRAQQLGLTALTATSVNTDAAFDALVANYQATYGGAGPAPIGNVLQAGNGTASAVSIAGYANTLVGGTGNDTLSVNGPGNSLIAGSGTDTLIAMGSMNLLDGGTGTDTLIATGDENMLVGADATSGSALLIATGSNNVLQGGNGSATETLTATGNNNVLTAGSGPQTLIATGSSNALQGGSGLDTLIASGDSNVLMAGSGTTTIIATGNSNQLQGGPGTAVLTATGDSDVLKVSGTSDATLTATGDNDVLSGGQGGENTLIADGSSDILEVGGGSNTLESGGITSAIVYDNGADTLAPTSGSATVDYELATAGIVADLATDFVTDNGFGGSDTLVGSIDGIVGSNYGDTLIGNNGNDTFSPGGGNNTIEGGSGSNTLDYNVAPAAVTVNLATGTASNGYGGTDTFINIENVIGSAFNDTFIAGAASGTLAGGGGFDTVSFVDETQRVVANLQTGVATVGAATIDLSTIGEVVGSNYSDTLTANNNGSVLMAGGGNATLIGGTGADTLGNGSGNDTIDAGSGKDTFLISPDGGTATISTYYQTQQSTPYTYTDTEQTGTDGEGNPVYGQVQHTGTHTTTVQGSAGTDVVSFAAGVLPTDVSYALSGNNLVVSVVNPANPSGTPEQVTFLDWTNALNRVDDFVFADGTVDTVNLSGSSLTETFAPSTASETLDGGTSFNVVSYAGAAQAVTVDLGANTVADGGATDTLENIQKIVGSPYNDTFYAGTTNETIDGGGGFNTLTFQNEAQGVVANLATGIATTGSTTITFSNIQELIGTHYADTLIAGHAGEVLEGLADAETLIATSGGNTLAASGDNDLLEGGPGNDTYLVNFGTGSTTIEGDLPSDTLSFLAGVEPSYVSLAASGGNLDVAVYDPSNPDLEPETVTLVGWMSTPANRLNTFEFADGTTINFNVAGSTINEAFTAGNASETLVGIGTANSVSFANDTSPIYLGDAGPAIINPIGIVANLATDTVQAGAATDTLVNIQTIVGSAGNDIFDAGSTSMSLNGAGGINTIDFAGESQRAVVNLGTGVATDGGATFTLSNIQEAIGSNYNDTLIGGSAPSILVAGTGNDTLIAGTGNTTFTAGSGNDTLLGSAGNDVYNVDSGYTVDGPTTIFDNYQYTQSYTYTTSVQTGTDGEGNPVYSPVQETGTRTLQGADGNNTLSFGGAVSVADVGLTIAGTNLDISIAGQPNSPQQVTILDWTNPLNAVQNFNFFDGTQLTFNLVGSTINENFIAGAASQTFAGLGTTNTLSFVNALQGVTVDLHAGTVANGSATDVISNFQQITGSADNDTFIAGSARETLNGGGGQNTLSFVDASQGVVANLVTGIATVGSTTFTISNFQDVIGSSHNDTLTASVAGSTLQAGSGNDTLLSSNGNNVFSAGSGADSLIGGAGNDVYEVARGDGSTTILDQYFYQQTYTYSETVQTGTDGEGNPVYGKVQETGTRTLQGADGTNTLVFGSGIAVTDLTYTVSGNNLDLSIANPGGAAQQVTLLSWMNALDNVQNFDFADGTTIHFNLVGTTIDETFTAGSASETLVGLGTQNEVSFANATQALTFNPAAMTVNAGAITDTLSNIQTIVGSSANDTFVFEPGAENVTFDGAGGQNTANFAAATQSATINLATGTATVGSATDVLKNIGTVIGSNNGDTFFAGSGSETLTGGSGHNTLSFADATAGVEVDLGGSMADLGEGINDTITNFQVVIGSAYNDTLIAGSTNDTLEAGRGDDTLEAGLGQDTLIGGSGNDTYLFSRGDGNAIVTPGSGATILSFGPGITAANVGFTFSGSSLVVSVTNEAQPTAPPEIITLQSWATAESALDGLQFSDGTLLSLEAVVGVSAGSTFLAGSGTETLDGTTGQPTLSFANAAQGVTVNLGTGTAIDGAATDTLSGYQNVIGSSYNDTLIAGSGNETLDGGTGNDSLIAGTGNDTLLGEGQGNDTFIVNRGDGTTTIYDNYTYQQTTTYTYSETVQTGTDGEGNPVYGRVQETGTRTSTVQGSAGNDTLSFGSGITVADLTLTVSGSNLDVSIYDPAHPTAPQQQVDLLSWMNTLNGIDTFAFADGTEIKFNVVGTTLNETFYPGSSNQTFAGLGTNNIVSYANETQGETVNLVSGTSVVNGVTDTLSNIQQLVGSAYNDTFVAGTSSETLNGGGGFNALSFADEAQRGVINLATGVATDGSASFALSNIQEAIASAYNDTLTAGTAGSELVAGAGADTLLGGTGGTTFAAGTGSGVMDGLQGNDTYIVGRGDGPVTIFDNYQYTQTYTYTESVQTGTDGEGNPVYGPVQETGTRTVQGSDGTNTLAFGPGITAADLLPTMSGNNLAISVVNPGQTSPLQQVTIDNWTDSLNRIQVLDLADGQQLSLQNETFSVTSTANATLNGTAGSVWLIGDANGDSLIGHSGYDILVANGSQDVLTGGAGTDVMFSNAAGNTLVAGTGTEIADYDLSNASVSLATMRATVNGSSASDTLVGISEVIISGSNDTLAGSTSGGDILVGLGSGNTIIDGGSHNTLYAAGATTLVSDGAGNTLVALNSQQSVLTPSGGAPSITTAGIQSAVEYSANDMNVNLVAGTASANGSSTSDTLVGTFAEGIVTGFNDTLTGASNQTLSAVNGILDTLIASGAGDVLDGGDDSRLMSDADGNILAGSVGGGDWAVYQGNNIDINLATGTATAAGSGHPADTLSNIANAASKGNDDTLIAGSGADTLNAIGNGNSLVAGSGADTLTASGSENTLIGGSGNDTYQFGRGSGSEIIVNSMGTGATDQLDFATSVDHDQLWFEQSGQNLDISLIGTNDNVTISNWFGNPSSQLTDFVASDGYTLAAAQVQQLVTAMAGLTPPPPGQTALSGAQATALEPVIAAAWQH